MDVCTCPCTRGVQAQTHTLTLTEMLPASAEICRRLHVSSFGMDAALLLFSQADLPSVATLGKAAKFPCASFPPLPPESSEITHSACGDSGSSVGTYFWLRL